MGGGGAGRGCLIVLGEMETAQGGAAGTGASTEHVLCRQDSQAGRSGDSKGAPDSGAQAATWSAMRHRVAAEGGRYARTNEDQPEPEQTRALVML